MKPENLNYLKMETCHCFRCHRDYKYDLHDMINCTERVEGNRDGGAMSCDVLKGGACQFALENKGSSVIGQSGQTTELTQKEGFNQRNYRVGYMTGRKEMSLQIIKKIEKLRDSDEYAMHIWLKEGNVVAPETEGAEKKISSTHKGFDDIIDFIKELHHE